MKNTGPAHLIKYLEDAQAQDIQRAIARRIATRLIMQYNVPPSYVDLVADPFRQYQPVLKDVVAQWVMLQANEEGLALREIGLPELQNRFAEHLHQVFHE